MALIGLPTLGKERLQAQEAAELGCQGNSVGLQKQKALSSRRLRLCQGGLRYGTVVYAVFLVKPAHNLIAASAAQFYTTWATLIVSSEA
jgi:hypothetical protein